MKITSAKFIKGIRGSDDALEHNFPQVALIGRSNVGKSSIINSLTGQKGLAITSSFPGRTKQINLFLIDHSIYFLDLPGYGFARASKEEREHLFKLIDWYLFKSPYQQKFIVLIIDANVGPTKDDLEILATLEEHNKKIVIVANKVDKIRKSEYDHKFEKIKDLVGNHTIIPYSSETKIGIKELTHEILS
jgi:GTP-binding protein